MVRRFTRLLRRWRPSDPYWDGFVNRPVTDPRNLVLDVLTRSNGGGVWAVKTDVHDPAAMTGHMQELARFWGADRCGVAATDPKWIVLDDIRERMAQAEAPADLPDAQELAQQYPFTLICAVRSTFGEAALGMGGRFSEQKLAVVNFNLRSYIREIGYLALFAMPSFTADVAVAAGLGVFDKKGRFVAGVHGRPVVFGDVLLTDLPLKPHAG